MEIEPASRRLLSIWASRDSLASTSDVVATLRYNELEDGMAAGTGLCSTGHVCEFAPTPCPMDGGIFLGGESESRVAGNEVDDAVGVGILVSEMVRERMSGCWWEGGEPTGTFDTMPAEDNSILDNQISDSGHTDAVDHTAGDGTAGTANSWQENECLTSSPLGLCEDGE